MNYPNAPVSEHDPPHLPALARRIRARPCLCSFGRRISSCHAIEHRMDRRQHSLLFRRLRKRTVAKTRAKNPTEYKGEPLSITIHARHSILS